MTGLASDVGEGEVPIGAVAIDGRQLTRLYVGSGDGGGRRGDQIEGGTRRPEICSGLQCRLGARRRQGGAAERLTV